MIKKIVSGGQTGVDRAALDVAPQLGLECGGWCPRGRRAEDGVIDERYPLQETLQRDYRTRTEWNVRDSDATLILNSGELMGGTALTVAIARQLQKPCKVIELPAGEQAQQGVRKWMVKHSVQVLNVAGPRASKQPEIYSLAVDFLCGCLQTAQTG